MNWNNIDLDVQLVCPDFLNNVNIIQKLIPFLKKYAF